MDLTMLRAAAPLTFVLILLVSFNFSYYYDKSLALAQSEQSSITNNDNNAGSNNQASDIQNFQPYQNDKFGISIKYPAGWNIEEGDKFLVDRHSKNIVTIIPPNGIDDSNLYHTYLSINVNPNSYGDLNSALTAEVDISKKKGFTLIDANTKAILAGQPAYQFTYTDSDQFDSKTTQIGTIFGGKEYYVIYQADPDVYDKYLPTVIQMLSTLQTSFGQGSSLNQQLQEPSGRNEVANQMGGSNDNNNNNSKVQPGSQLPSDNQHFVGGNISEYNSTEFGFSIQYPTGSSVTQMSNGASFRFPEGSGYADITIGKLGSITLDDFTQYKLNSLYRDFPNAKISNVSDGSLSGYPGRFVILENNGLRALAHWTKAGDIGYMIFFAWNPTTSPNFISLAAKMASSFQVTNQPGNNAQGQLANNNVTENQQLQQQQLLSQNFLQYQSPNMNFSIKYPNNWTAVESSQGVSFFPKQGLPAKITVNVTENGTFNKMDLNDYTNTKINDLRSEFKGFHFEDENDTVLSGNKAHYLEFSFVRNSTTYAGASFYTLMGDKVYEIVVTSPVTNIKNIVPILRIMNNSFSIYQVDNLTTSPNSGLNSTTNQLPGLYRG